MYEFRASAYVVNTKPGSADYAGVSLAASGSAAAKVPLAMAAMAENAASESASFALRLAEGDAVSMAVVNNTTAYCVFLEAEKIG